LIRLRLRKGERHGLLAASLLIDLGVGLLDRSKCRRIHARCVGHLIRGTGDVAAPSAAAFIRFKVRHLAST
jgi:hypothetical protein